MKVCNIMLNLCLLNYKIINIKVWYEFLCQMLGKFLECVVYILMN